MPGRYYFIEQLQDNRGDTDSTHCILLDASRLSLNRIHEVKNAPTNAETRRTQRGKQIVANTIQRSPKTIKTSAFFAFIPACLYCMVSAKSLPENCEWCCFRGKGFWFVLLLVLDFQPVSRTRTMLTLDPSGHVAGFDTFQKRVEIHLKFRHIRLTCRTARHSLRSWRPPAKPLNVRPRGVPKRHSTRCRCSPRKRIWKRK